MADDLITIHADPDRPGIVWMTSDDWQRFVAAKNSAIQEAQRALAESKTEVEQYRDALACVRRVLCEHSADAPFADDAVKTLAVRAEAAESRAERAEAEVRRLNQTEPHEYQNHLSLIQRVERAEAALEKADALADSCDSWHEDGWPAYSYSSAALAAYRATRAQADMISEVKAEVGKAIAEADEQIAELDREARAPSGEGGGNG